MTNIFKPLGEQAPQPDVPPPAEDHGGLWLRRRRRLRPALLPAQAAHLLALLAGHTKFFMAPIWTNKACFAPGNPLGIFVNFTSFIEMYILEGPDLGHSMILF